MRKLLLAGIAALSVLNAAEAHAGEGSSRIVWQCGNVRVITRPVDSTTSEREFRFLGTEYQLTGIEKSNNRFVWDEDGLYLNGKLCWPVEPVTCLRPDGTSESCESRQVPLPRPRPAEAPEPVPIPKTVLHYEPGGALQDHIKRWEALAESGDDVEIRGPCVSGCTMIMAYVPSNRICFGWGASLRFHLAGTPENPSTGASLYMHNRYPQDIRMWLRDRGGVEKMTVEKFWVLDATELWEMGYRKCDPEAPPVPMT